MEHRYSHLTLDDRCEIYRLRENGASCRAIAHALGRLASTLSRELNRNRLPRSGYKPTSASRMAQVRKQRLPKIERVSPLKVTQPFAGRLTLEQLSTQSASRHSMPGFMAPMGGAKSCTACCQKPRRRGDDEGENVEKILQFQTVGQSTRARQRLIFGLKLVTSRLI